MTQEKKRMLRGFRIDPEEAPPRRDRTGPMEVEDCCEALQQATGSDLVDIVRASIGGHPLVIVVDDEGLLKDRLVSVLIGQRPWLVGTALVLGDGGDGKLRGLTEEELLAVSKATKLCAVMDEDGGDMEFRWMLRADEVVA